MLNHFYKMQMVSRSLEFEASTCKFEFFYTNHGFAERYCYKYVEVLLGDKVFARWQRYLWRSQGCNFWEEAEEPCDRRGRGVDCRPTQMPVDTGAQTSRQACAQIVEYCTDLLKFARIWWRPKKIVWWHMRGWRACPSVLAPSASPLAAHKCRRHGIIQPVHELWRFRDYSAH